MTSEVLLNRKLYRLNGIFSESFHLIDPLINTGREPDENVCQDIFRTAPVPVAIVSGVFAGLSEKSRMFPT